MTKTQEIIDWFSLHHNIHNKEGELNNFLLDFRCPKGNCLVLHIGTGHKQSEKKPITVQPFAYYENYSYEDCLVINIF
jgi:hypothetical protein